MLPNWRTYHDAPITDLQNSMDDVSFGACSPDSLQPYLRAQMQVAFTVAIKYCSVRYDGPHSVDAGENLPVFDCARCL